MKSYLRHPVPTMRASLLYDVPVIAIVLRRRRLVPECADLRPIRHEHRLLHRIRVRSLARSRCGHPAVDRRIFNLINFFFSSLKFAVEFIFRSCQSVKYNLSTIYIQEQFLSLMAIIFVSIELRRS